MVNWTDYYNEDSPGACLDDGNLETNKKDEREVIGLCNVCVMPHFSLVNMRQTR